MTSSALIDVEGAISGCVSRAQQWACLLHERNEAGNSRQPKLDRLPFISQQWSKIQKRELHRVRVPSPNVGLDM
jgi:hypothetical protein